MDRISIVSKLLAPYYPEYPFLAIGSVIYPVFLLPARGSQIHHPETILGPLDSKFKISIDPSMKEHGDLIIDRLKASGAHLEDLPTYCTKNITEDSDGSVRIESCLGTYFEMMQTCEVVSSEIREVLSHEGTHMPFRKRLHALEGTSRFLLAPRHTSSALGISALIVFRKGESLHALVGQRHKARVALAPGSSHVVPACMFQPVHADPEEEYDVTYNVYREYLEEVFSIEEEAGTSTFAKSKVFLDPNIRELTDLIEKGNALFLYTGLCFNLASLRPDICILIYIDDPSWYEAHREGKNGLSEFRFNNEWESTSEIEIHDESGSIDPARYIPANATSAAAGCIYLAMKALNDLAR
jgi:hypothetical protein